MELSDFEEYVDREIILRGEDYYLEGLVENLNEKKKGQWTATVKGSSDYKVTITLENENIVKWNCNCPFDYGSVCKHVVAVLYEIREQAVIESDALIEGASIAEPGDIQMNIQEARNKKESINSLINKLSIDELKAFITEQIKQSPEFKNAFLIQFSNKQTVNSKAQYVVLINNIANNAAGRHGFIDYSSASKFTNQVLDLLEKSEELRNEEDISGSIAILQAIIEEMPDIVSSMDDSNGGAGDIMEKAFEIFRDIALDAPPLLKDKLFEYCLKEYPLKKYHDFSFDSYFMDILPMLITSPDQEKLFFDLIDRQIKIFSKDEYGEYTIISLLKAKIGYLENNKRNEEALKIIEDSINISDFRDMLIAQAVKRKDYILAKKLCMEGIKIAKEKKHSGTEKSYISMLLEVAEQENDKQQALLFSEQLFIQFGNSMDYYRKIKQYWDKATWSEKCEQIINVIKTPKAQGSYYSADILAKIFIEEKYFERLLLLLQLNNRRIQFIDQYIEHLTDMFPSESIQIYSKAIELYAANTGRHIYENVVGYLKKMAKIPGGKEAVTAMVTNFKKQYANRRAMLEILNAHFK